MRTKTHWFRDDAERTPEEVGAAVAMRLWRQATQAVRTLAEDGPITDRTGGHLALVEELLLFGVQYADRLAWRRGLEDETRRRLIETAVKRLADGIADHDGSPEAGRALLRRASERLDEYAAIRYDGDDPGLPAYNVLGSRGCEAVDRARDVWLHGRLAEVEGPELANELRPVLDGLLANLDGAA